jgi:hypothetical protein
MVSGQDPQYACTCDSLCAMLTLEQEDGEPNKAGFTREIRGRVARLSFLVLQRQFILEMYSIHDRNPLDGRVRKCVDMEAAEGSTRDPRWDRFSSTRHRHLRAFGQPAMSQAVGNVRICIFFLRLS